MRIYLQHTLYKLDLVHIVTISNPPKTSTYTKLSLIKTENVKVMWQYTDNF